MPPRPIQPRPYLILFALWLMVFSSSSQVIIIAPILPRIGEALAIPMDRWGWLITAYALLLCVFALIAGPVSDRVGRRRILLIGSSCMAGALYLHGIADSFTSLLAVRALAGAAGGALSGAAVSYVGDYFPYERRGWANGWVMSGIAFGQVIGIPLGTYLADLLGFRWPFLIYGICMTLAVVLIWIVVPQPNVELNPHRLSFGRVFRNYWELLQRREIRAVVITYFLMFFSFGLYTSYLPTWLEVTLGVGGAQLAALYGTGGVVNVATSLMAGRLSDRIGRKPLIVTSCAGMGVVMLLTTVLVTNMLIAHVLFAAAMMMVAMRMSPYQSLISSLVPGERRGILMSLAVAIGQAGAGIGGGFAGPLFTRWGYVSNTAIGAALILYMAWLVRQYIPEPANAPPPPAVADAKLANAPTSLPAS